MSSSDSAAAQLSTDDARALTAEFGRFFAELLVNIAPFVPANEKDDFPR